MMHKLFFWLFFLLFPFLYGYAQVQPLPLDPEIVYGKLDNGLTYYIRQNAQPERRAEFYLVQRTGSLQEEENQRGLAHVLEHLAFSGSKHFPQGIDDYLERIGLKKRDNVNAHTGFNETSFLIMNVPIEKKGVVDSCLLFLRDVSSDLLMDPSAIERERAIIREEWRLDRNSVSRLRELQFPVLLEGSKYAERLPIGRIEVIESFTQQDLREYYEKWYRPDLQAIIVVGSLNPKKVKERITALFGGIPVPPTAIDLPKELVLRRDTPVVTIAKDKEASNFMVNLFFKHDKMPDSLYASVEGVRKDFLQMVSATMLNERFDGLLYDANPPFVYAQSYDGDYLDALTQAAWSVVAVAEEGKIDSTLYVLARETERVKRFGFTHSEYERVKANVLKYYETQYLERKNGENSTYANACVNHFVYGGYLPANATEFDLINRIAGEVSLEEVNEHARAIFTQRDVVIAVAGPEKEASGIYPDEAALLAIFNDIHTNELDPYQKEDYLFPLLDEMPVPGEIIKEEKDAKFNATVLTLSNGVKVVAKPTALNEGGVFILGSSPGGNTLFDEKDITNLKVMRNVVPLGGLGGCSQASLDRILSGKNVNCSFLISESSEGIGGSSSVSDLRTFFELVYLYFTDTQMDESADVSSFPDGQTTLQIFYDTDPQKLERINAVVLAELHRLANSPAREKDLAKVKENLKKTNEESRKSNVYWLNVINGYYFDGFNAHESYLQTLNSIAIEDVRAFADKLLSAGNHIELIMSPEE